MQIAGMDMSRNRADQLSISDTLKQNEKHQTHQTRRSIRNACWNSKTNQMNTLKHTTQRNVKI